MKRTLFLALLTALALPALADEPLQAGDFSVDATPQLTVRYKGETVLSGDRCVSFRGLKAGEPAFVEPTQGRLVRQGNVLTTLAQKGRNSLRREVLVTPEAVHVTFEMRVFGGTGGSHLQYDLFTPGAFLDGVEYEASTGAPRGPLGKATGAFSLAESKAFEYLVRSVRYVILKRPGAECSLDFNPEGPWVGETNYGDTYNATPYHTGEDFRWAMLCSGGRNGGIFRGKIILRPGATPYASLHSTEDVEYTSQFPVALALDFSPHTQAAPGGNWRWRNPEQVRTVERETGGALYRDFAAAAQPGTEGVLEVDLPSGLYLLTLNLRDDQQATGPFSVLGDEGTLLENVTVERGQWWHKTVPFRVRNGQGHLRLTGDWKLSALTIQTLLLETEDFLFDQGFWNMEIPAPDEG